MSQTPSLTNSEIVAIVVVFIVLVVVYGLLWMGSWYVTRIVAKQGVSRSKWTWLRDHFGILVLLYSVSVMIALPALFYSVYEDRLLEGILASIALIWFLRTQLPSLLPPVVAAVFHHWNEIDGEYIQAASDSDSIRPNAETFLNLRLVNAGLSTYETCGCSVTLPREFEIIPWGGENPDSRYWQADYAKPFSLQRQNNCARFSPDPAHILHPGDSVWYPILVKSPTTPSEFRAKIEFSTRSCWSATMLSKEIAVDRA